MDPADTSPPFPSGTGAAAVELPDPSRPPIDVAVVCPGLTPSTYMRLLSPLAWLVARGHATFTLITEDQLQSSRRELISLVLRGGSFHREVRLRAEMSLRDAAIVILQRSTSPMGERAHALARAAGAGVIYDCDDNFLAVSENTLSIGEYYNSPTFAGALSSCSPAPMR